MYGDNNTWRVHIHTHIAHFCRHTNTDNKYNMPWTIQMIFRLFSRFPVVNFPPFAPSTTVYRRHIMVTGSAQLLPTNRACVIKYSSKDLLLMLVGNWRQMLSAFHKLRLQRRIRFLQLLTLALYTRHVNVPVGVFLWDSYNEVPEKVTQHIKVGFASCDKLPKLSYM